MRLFMSSYSLAWMSAFHSVYNLCADTPTRQLFMGINLTPCNSTGSVAVGPAASFATNQGSELISRRLLAHVHPADACVQLSGYAVSWGMASSVPTQP